MAESNSSNANSGKEYAEIIVVRHGETDWNAQNKIQGQLDVELNEVGIQQAAAVADRLSREPKIAAVYSSDLKRAFKTAEMIAASCGGLEGLVFHAIADLNPVAYKAFASHRTDQEIPGGGESLDQLLKRSASALQRIGMKHIGERVVVVTHGGFIRALYKRAHPNGRSVGKVLNTSVSIFHLYEGDKWIIKSWSDVSHLNQTGYLSSGFGGDKNSA